MEKISKLLGCSLSRTLYVRISTNRMHVRHVESRREAELAPDRPFTRSQLLIAEFTVAQRLLKRAIREVSGGFGLAPVIVMHPLVTVDGEPSESERRLLLDLGYESGARYVAVAAQELSDGQVMQIARDRARLCA
ncbi:MAG TPA: hypothetical protein VMP00_02925 [Burkholderiales bacterium]|nr:hypothetical protein [Burkholderiales bacterium]